MLFDLVNNNFQKVYRSRTFVDDQAGQSCRPDAVSVAKSTATKHGIEEMG